MRVQFVATTAEKLDTVPKIDGQIIAVLDQLGYYYDFNGVRYQVNDGGSFVEYSPTLTEGTKIGSIEIDGVSTDIFAETPPSQVSQLANDVGFVTNVVSNLVNYYLKTETYSKDEVDALVATVKGISFQAVDELPTIDIKTDVIYLVPKPSASPSNARNEFINTTGDSTGWELIGNTDIDLSDYVASDELELILSNYALISSIPTKTSDLVNDSNFISDPDYVHTDNNFSDADKARLQTATSVEVTPIATQGTPIATITIDGVDTVIYASGGLLPRLLVNTEDGSTVTATDGTDTINFVETEVGVYQGNLTDFGTWTVTAVYNEDSRTEQLDVDTVKIYHLNLGHYQATLTLSFPAGSTGYFGKQGEIPIQITENPYTVTLTSTGTYVATTTYNGVSYTTEIVTGASGETISSFCPDPSDTSLAANNIQTWLMYGDVTGSYANLNAVLSDATALAKLMASEFAVDYMLRSSDWMSTIGSNANALQAINASNIAAEKVLCNDAWNSYIYNQNVAVTGPYCTYLTSHCPEMTSDTEPSGRVIYDSQQAGYEAYKIMYHMSGSVVWWRSDTSDNVHYIGYDTEEDNILLTNFWLGIAIASGRVTSVPDVMIQGSVDGLTWEDVESYTPLLDYVSTGNQTRITIDYCKPSALRGYRAVRVAFINGVVAPGVDHASGWLCNVWRHVFN